MYKAISYEFDNSLYEFRPGLHDIGLLFMPDRFPESGTKSTPECVYRKPGKQPRDTNSC